MNGLSDKDAAYSVSASPSPVDAGISRISIGSIGQNDSRNNNTDGPKTVLINSFGESRQFNGNNSHALMFGNGELVSRRSPSFRHNLPASSKLTNHINSGSQLRSDEVGKNFLDVSSELRSNSYEDKLNNETQIELLNEQIVSLQQQLIALTDSQSKLAERYMRSKLQNDELLSRLHSLEDQLREHEITSEEHAREEEKRFKETMAKQMKVKQQEYEIQLNANYQLQQEMISLRKDLMKSEKLIKTMGSDKHAIEIELQEKNHELCGLDEEVHKLKQLVKNLKDEESVKTNIINILNEELEDNHRSQRSVGLSSTPKQDSQNLSDRKHAPDGLVTTTSLHRTPQNLQQSVLSRHSSGSTSGFDDDLTHLQQRQDNLVLDPRTLQDIDMLESNLAKLRTENKRLRESNEELQAQLLNVQLEEGRSLIQEGNKSYSLADELGDVDVPKLLAALKEQQDDNARLRRYIDEIILKIVERNPEILDKTS